MKHIEINLWLACNHKCIFCMSWMARNKVLWFEKKETIFSEIEQLFSKGYTSLWFLWWEPTLHPDFLDIVLYAKTRGFSHIEVISNGSKFCQKKFLSQAIENGITRISLSLHSLDEKEEAFLLGWIPAALSQKIESIRNIQSFISLWELRRELSINIVVTQKNYKSIKRTILGLLTLGVKSFRLNFVQLEWYSTHHYKDVAIRYEEFLPELKEILTLTLYSPQLKINFEAIPWCYSWLNYMNYLKFSEQNIDRQKDKISTDDQDSVTREIMSQLSRRKELKIYLQKCEHCFLKWECEWIWKRYADYFSIS